MAEKQTLMTGDSRERVAFDLMKLIAEVDTKAIKERLENPKQHYLALFRECLDVVKGGKAEA